MRNMALVIGTVAGLTAGLLAEDVSPSPLLSAYRTAATEWLQAGLRVNPPGERPSFSHVELECLALNIYHEARGEPANGQLAVAHVVLNRASDHRFPDQICDVVKEGGHQVLHRCQFSWWCDGLSDQPVDHQAWQSSRQTAWTVLAQNTSDPSRGALWYHADYVNPYWASAKRPVATIGRHIFYQDPPSAEPPIYR